MGGWLAAEGKAGSTHWQWPNLLSSLQGLCLKPLLHCLHHAWPVNLEGNVLEEPGQAARALGLQLLAHALAGTLQLWWQREEGV